MEKNIMNKTSEILTLIKESEEYKNYLKYKTLLEKDEELKEKYLEYRNMLSKVYTKNSDTNNIEDVEISNRMFALYEYLNHNEITREFIIHEENIYNLIYDLKYSLADFIEVL